MRIKKIDGFEIPMELWEEIKDSYVNTPSLWEKQLLDEAINIARNAVVLIDETIKPEDYTPDTSSDNMWDIAHTFANDKIIQAALNEDEVLTEKLIEVLCGINKESIEKQVLLIIYKAVEMITDKERQMFH